MKDIIRTAVIDGHEIRMAYTVTAMIAINKLLKQDDGESLELVPVILGDDPDTFELFTEIVEILNYSGELLRKSRGLDDGESLSAARIRAALSPKDLLTLKKEAMDTIIAGLGREENNSEVDMGLAELEKKNPRRRRKS
jgi:hypothetical protein